MFPLVSVGWLVNQQDYNKTVELIYTKPGRRMNLSSIEIPLTFGADPDKGTNPGILFSLSLT